MAFQGCFGFFLSLIFFGCHRLYKAFVFCKFYIFMAYGAFVKVALVRFFWRWGFKLLTTHRALNNAVADLFLFMHVITCLTVKLSATKNNRVLDVRHNQVLRHILLACMHDIFDPHMDDVWSHYDQIPCCTDRKNRIVLENQHKMCKCHSDQSQSRRVSGARGG